MKDASSNGQVRAWLQDFSDALTLRDADALKSLFCEECYWRDLVAFTWNIKTLEGREAIIEMATATLEDINPKNWSLDGDAVEKDGVQEAWFTFETDVAQGRGHVRLKDGKCWTLLTTAQELKGHEEKKGLRRVLGAVHGAADSHETWTEKRDREIADLGYSEQPNVVIIGGGQGGIALGARLRRLGVSTIIIEKNPRAGDSWRNRYKSLCLHDPVWYDHLPYLPFPDDWPVFTPKDKLGDWLESYTKIMELNYWTKSTCTSATYDEDAGEWTVTVDRDGKKVVLKPKQLVLATGMSGVPNIPDFPGIEKFKGEYHHSSQHEGPDAYADKKVVVIGSNNSAHDISAALWNAGADVTMVQRSSTHVSRSDTLMELGLKELYSEEAVARGITVEEADMIAATTPYALLAGQQKPMYDEMQIRDADFYERLEKAGFEMDFGADGSGLYMKFLRRGSGYYIDVGASELIANGSIKLAHGQITEITESGVILADGSEVDADLIVFATGYGSMNGWAADLISQDVADKVGKCWGLGSDTPKDPGPWEGELRNMWKPTQQKALWFHGGNLYQSRHFSLFLALQLKAREAGIPTPVYGLAKSYHKS
ncbi:MAG: NAD(P)/FAD-dependent oxidoreductase [Paracoccaceae bacterium]